MSEREAKIEPALLRRLLRYEPESGLLYWRERKAGDCATARAVSVFNSKSAGREAFTSLHEHGYRLGAVQGIALRAHRVIWAIVHGQWPDGHIDHRDGNPANNRISNIRIATRSQNMCNRKAAGVSEYLGVSWYAPSSKWRAKIVTDRRQKHLGYFDDEAAAAKAYDAAAIKFHGEFARPNFP